MGNPTWLTPFCEAYDDLNGTMAHASIVGQMARYFKPLVDAVGTDVLASHWRQYLRSQSPDFASPADFAKKWARYKPVVLLHPAVPLVTDGWIDPEWQEWLDRMAGLGK